MCNMLQDRVNTLLTVGHAAVLGACGQGARVHLVPDSAQDSQVCHSGVLNTFCRIDTVYWKQLLLEYLISDCLNRNSRCYSAAPMPCRAKTRTQRMVN